MIDHKVFEENGLREVEFNPREDKNFQVALRFASPERKKQLDEIQVWATYLFYLRKCMETNGVFDEAKLVYATNPLIEDENFRKAMEVAPPERKQELQKILELQPSKRVALIRSCPVDHLEIAEP